MLLIGRSSRPHSVRGVAIRPSWPRSPTSFPGSSRLGARAARPTSTTTSPQPTPQSQHYYKYESPRQRLSFRQKLHTYFILSTAAQLIIFFVYEPVRDYGLFDWIAHSTIFRIIPFAKVKRVTEAPEPDSKPSIYQAISRPDEIRLLIVEPGSADDELEVRLINVRLSWRTKYEALSYSWGDASIKRALICSGQRIDVTVSLHDALTDLRLPRTRRYIWADGLCINQTDDKEKEQQIMLMRQIYGGARQVLIYLGKADESVDGAISDFRWLDWKFMPIHTQRYWSRAAIFGPLGIAFIDRLPKMKPLKEEEFDWARVVNLLQRSWFQRTWIIQEAVLAKRAQVVCGRNSVPWTSLERVVIAMNHYHGLVRSIPGYKDISIAVEAINLMRSARRDAYKHILTPEMWLVTRYITGSRREFSKMLDLAEESRRFGCTKPHDKIYGMLGITDEDTNSDYLVPDYSKPPGDAFRKFVIWDILHNKSLRVLGVSSDKDGGTKFTSKQPSWVPDFTQLDPHCRLTRFDNRAPYLANLGYPHVEARVSDEGTVLHIKGTLVDRIHTVAKTSASRFFDSDLSAKEKRQLRLNGDADAIFVTKSWLQEAMGIWQEAVARGVVAGGRAHHHPPLPLVASDLWVTDKHGEFTAYPDHWTYFLRALICDRTDLSDFATVGDLPYVAGHVRAIVDEIPLARIFAKSERPAANRAFQALVHAGQSRRFASTWAGLAGFVPMRAREGDVVVVLHGSRVPIVLRPREDGRFELVGECYMHGLMWGKGNFGLVGQGARVDFSIV